MPYIFVSQLPKPKREYIRRGWEPTQEIIKNDGIRYYQNIAIFEDPNSALTCGKFPGTDLNVSLNLLERIGLSGNTSLITKIWHLQTNSKIYSLQCQRWTTRPGHYESLLTCTDNRLCVRYKTSLAELPHELTPLYMQLDKGVLGLFSDFDHIK